MSRLRGKDYEKTDGWEGRWGGEEGGGGRDIACNVRDISTVTTGGGESDIDGDTKKALLASQTLKRESGHEARPYLRHCSLSRC